MGIEENLQTINPGNEEIGLISDFGRSDKPQVGRGARAQNYL